MPAAGETGMSEFGPAITVRLGADWGQELKEVWPLHSSWSSNSSLDQLNECVAWCSSDLCEETWHQELVTPGVLAPWS